MRSDTWLQDRKRQGLWVKWVLARACRKAGAHPHLCTSPRRSRNAGEHRCTRADCIYSVGTSASLRRSEELPAHLLKIKQSAVMSYLISFRQADEKHFSRKSRVCDRLNAQTSLWHSLLLPFSHTHPHTRSDCGGSRWWMRDACWFGAKHDIAFPQGQPIRTACQGKTAKALKTGQKQTH